MVSQVATYPLALFKLMDEEDTSAKQPPLGFAKRAGTESSTFNVPAHSLLKALVSHAPSAETMAKEFLAELGKCGNPLVETLAEEAYQGICTTAPDEWADIVHQKLQESPGDLSNITQLGSHYLSHLVIPFRNPGEKKTPQDSIHPTPNCRRIDEIEELLKEANRNSQSALKDLASFNQLTDQILA
ncbi:hypothetical protein D9615_001639 [Tricholomella constricta]|uniref:Uncharacterized protein n=1 Tax=Tricholomella constricta TaxID=117010 RepID=A0A8H5HQ07_9AGAR|nr:hypothetical protein D9615_001639 [Tricholomella constricta]